MTLVVGSYSADQKLFFFLCNDTVNSCCAIVVLNPCIYLFIYWLCNAAVSSSDNIASDNGFSLVHDSQFVSDVCLKYTE
jgi:hypothetical protein